MTFRCHTPLSIMGPEQRTTRPSRAPDPNQTMKTFASTPLPVAAPHPHARRRALSSQGMNGAHALAALRRDGFHLDISGPTPDLVTRDEKVRVPVDDLNLSQLEAAKHLAHDQYVRAMLAGDADLDTHRATLNFLSRRLQKAAPVPATMARPDAGVRKPKRPVRRSADASRQAA
jgi:hypothetical protein